MLIGNAQLTDARRVWTINKLITSEDAINKHDMHKSHVWNKRACIKFTSGLFVSNKRRIAGNSA